MRAPRQLRVTSAGRAFLVLTLGVGVGALNTGNNLLYLVLGLQLATIVASGLLSERCLRGLQVTRLHADGLFACEQLVVPCRVIAGRSGAFALSVAEVGANDASAVVVQLRRAESVTIRVPLPATRRGPLELRAVRITTLFPLGLFAKSRIFDLPQTLWIYPRRRANPSPRALDAPGSGDMMNSLRAGGGGDLLGLRELAPFEDARRIHWLKTAAVGKPLQTEREREEDRTIELILPSAPTPQALDGPCEEEAARALRFLAEGFQVGLTTPTARLEPGVGTSQAHRILELLAREGYVAPGLA